MKAGDLTEVHHGLTVQIGVSTLPLRPDAVGHRHTQTLTIARVDRHPTFNLVRVWDEGNPYYSAFHPDEEVLVLS